MGYWHSCYRHPLTLWNWWKWKLILQKYMLFRVMDEKVLKMKSRLTDKARKRNGIKTTPEFFLIIQWRDVMEGHKKLIQFIFSAITVQHPIFNNYSPKAQWILSNNPRDQVEGIIRQYSRASGNPACEWSITWLKLQTDFALRKLFSFQTNLKDVSKQ